MGLSVQEMALAISLGNFILTWGVALYMYLANKNKATNQRISQMETDITERIEGLDHRVDTRLDDHAQRITAIEAGYGRHPTHRELGQIHDKINGVANLVAGFGGRLESMEAQLRLIMSRITDRGLS